MKQVFVLPAQRGQVSGGHLYNRLLIAALRRAGVELRVTGIEGALHEAGSQTPTRYWLDSLMLDRAQALRAAMHASSHLFLVVHYFPSLQPGLRARARHVRRALEDDAFRAADGFLFTSSFAASEVAKRGVKDKPFAVVPPALAVVPRGKPAARPRRFSALMAAHVTRGKGVLEFLRAFASGLSPPDDFRVEIAGGLDEDPEYAMRCMHWVDKHAALRGKVRFAGALDRRAMRAAYERHAFFVSASGMETFGMALQEARAFGLYILALDGGNAASHVQRAADGAVFPSLNALAARAVELVRDRGARETVLAHVRPAPASRDWADAAAQLLLQLPMPQPRIARNMRPPRNEPAAKARPATSSRSSVPPQARGMSPRGTKVQ